MDDKTNSKVSLEEVVQRLDALQDAIASAQSIQVKHGVEMVQRNAEMDQIRKLFAQFMSTDRSSDAQDPSASRGSTPMVPVQHEVQPDVKMSELRRMFAHYMSSIRPIDTSDPSGSRSPTPIQQAHTPISQVKVKRPYEAPTKLKVLDVKEGPILARKLLNPAAHQVLDEMPIGMVSKEIDEHIPLQSLWAGNSSIDQIQLPAHDLGNVPVVTYAFVERLSFDPGGGLISSEIEALCCLRSPDDLSRDVTKSMVEAYGRAEIPIINPGGRAWLLGGEPLNLECVDLELQLFDDGLSGMPKPCSKFCLDPKGEWVLLASMLCIWKGGDVMDSTPSCSLSTAWLVWLGIYFGTIKFDPGGMEAMALLISGNPPNREPISLKKSE